MTKINFPPAVPCDLPPACHSARHKYLERLTLLPVTAFARLGKPLTVDLSRRETHMRAHVIANPSKQFPYIEFAEEITA